MGAFKYEGLNREGKKVNGSIEAVSAHEAKRLLRRQGVRAKKIQKPSIFEVDLGMMFSEKAGLKGFSDEDLTRFTKQLSTLINAGVPILQSLEILHKQEKNFSLKASLIRITQAVGDGKSLFEAMETERSFDKLYCHLVKAGEVAGILNEILDKLGEFLDKKIALKKQIKSAMTYPTIVCIVGVVVVAGLMTFVVPQFVGMLTESGQEIPWVTQAVIDTSVFFQSYIFHMFVSAVLAVGGIFYAKKTPKGKIAFDKIMIKLPLLNSIVIKGSLSSFSQTLSTMLSSGISIIDALEICSETIDNSVISRDIKRVKMAVEKGKNLTEPLKRIDYFPDLITQMIYVGESTGNLDDMLKKVADVFEVEVEGSIQGMTQLIEPLILVGLGGVIGFVLIAMYLPIFMSAGGA